ncbi:MAG: tetratricopeptide repeat protein [Bacteroidetes bacterium]|nr:tetratricopeptide repeat protein [Bacteroidota bacterium]MCY4205974.1 tetratricopeptide repeat protein [Bacteroidota bacterium]
MSNTKAPRRVIGQRSTEVSSSWYTPLLALYYGNRRILTGAAVGLIIVIAGVFGYNYIQGERDAQAQEYLGAIILEYERSEYRVALDGSGENIGLLDIIDRYGGTPAGNTARFYAGNAHFELEEYDLALKQFEGFNTEDDFLGASTTAGRAAIYELNGDFSNAGDLFRRAAGMGDNEIRAPYYLRSAARTYLKAGELDAAEDVILEAKDDYPDSDLINEFDFMLGQVLALK